MPQPEPFIADGYSMAYKFFKSGQWDTPRVHKFVEYYVTKLNQKVFYSHSPQQAVLGTFILWLGWLFFNSGSSGGITNGLSK